MSYFSYNLLVKQIYRYNILWNKTFILFLYRPSITFPDHFYCPSTEKEAIFTMQRDIPSFDKYTLSEETKEALKTPDFDIWQWEPNEVRKT